MFRYLLACAFCLVTVTLSIYICSVRLCATLGSLCGSSKFAIVRLFTVLSLIHLLLRFVICDTVVSFSMRPELSFFGVTKVSGFMSPLLGTH